MALGGRGRRMAGATAQAAPTAPGNGSGGPGILGGAVSLSPARAEIGDIATGRITLAMLDFTLLAMIGFYLWTRSAQGGG